MEKNTPLCVSVGNIHIPALFTTSVGEYYPCAMFFNALCKYTTHFVYGTVINYSFCQLALYWDRKIDKKSYKT